MQFIKGSWHYGELDAAKMLGDDRLEIRPMGRGFVKIGGAETDPEDMRLCEEAWEFGRAQMESGRYDLVVFDEINYVISYHMLDVEKVVAAFAGRPERVHVICTGPQRASETGRGGRPGDRDARSEAPLHQRHSGAARNRLLTFATRSGRRSDVRRKGFMAWFKR